MKAYIIRMLIDYILDALIEVLARLSKQSGNTIDDQAVSVIFENREQIKSMIKQKL